MRGFHKSGQRNVEGAFIPRAFFCVFLVMLFATLLSHTAAATISYVQVNSSVTKNTGTLSAAYSSVQTAGDMNIVVIGWDSGSITVSSVTDSKGNSYKLAASYSNSSVGIAQSIYYASNIVAAAAGANTITVKLSGSTGYPDLRILEYSGVNTLDKTASGEGTATTASSGSVTTTQASELLFGACYNFGTTNGPGSGFTQRILTGDSDNAEDEVVSATGSYAATASVSGGSGNNWVMQLATFYSNATGGTPPAPTNLTATVASSSQINLSWTGSTGATSYNVLRSTTSGAPYSQIASGVTTASYSNTGLSSGTTYYYVVQAVNSSGTSGNSNQASATTVPAAPTGLTATTASSTQINLSWTASTGATSYNILSSTTNGGPYSQIAGGVTTTSYSNTGLTASTTYYYVVQAVDSGGTSANSSQASATTSASSCSAVPSAPTGLAASGTTSSSTTLSWTAVTPPTNCTISSYTVLEGGTAIATTSSTSYSVTGLSASTKYTFTVEATDADGTSGASSPLNVTTSAATGATYYVAPPPTGSNSNPGTSSSAPWATISYAASQVAPGDTVLVAAGTYNESVPVTISGTSSAPVIFNGQGVAIVDGTGVACCTSPSFVSSNAFVGGNTQGLFTIGASAGLNYVTIEGFTIQNYKTSSTSDVPAGVMIVGGGTGIVVTNNTIQNIQSTAKQSKSAGPNAYGIGVFGTSSTPLSVTVTHNTVTGCLTGESETTTYNGNVQNFVVAYNTIYNNDNIGMDAIGFEGTGPTGSDQATNGDVYGNVIYNNSAINNPGEQGGGQDGGYDEDGLYCDGCTQVVFERNLVYANDIGIEAASEIGGDNSSNVIIRNNLVYGSNYVGITVGGYSSSACSGDCGGGGSENITIVNNSLYSNTMNTSSQAGEFQVQYRASGIVFENNIAYAGSDGLLLYGITSGEGVTLNYNDYYTTASTPTFQLQGTSYSSFSSYQSGSGQDKNSVFANPDFVTLPTCSASGYTPPGGYSSTKASSCSSAGNLDLASGSPALNTGNTALGTPSGSGWSSYEESEPFVGSSDYAGNARINSSGEINIGAYEQ